jgi:hypothetical protein
MSVIRLIAWREYLENVRTKGFWLGILLLPLMVIGVFLIQSNLSESSPTRHYLFVDQSGQYRDTVESAIELEHQRQVLQAFVNYLLDYRKEGDLELTAANARSAADQLVDDVGADEASALNQWIENGGLDFALTMATPYLKECPALRKSRAFVYRGAAAGRDRRQGAPALTGRTTPALPQRRASRHRQRGQRRNFCPDPGAGRCRRSHSAARRHALR